MSTPRLAMLVTVVFLALCGPLISATPEVTSSGVQLIYAGSFPDPHVTRDDDYFYITSTWPRMIRTRTFAPDDIKVYTLDLDFGDQTRKVEGCWAMRLYRHTDGSWHAYASVHYLGYRTLITHFSPAPGEVWTNEKPITRWKLDKVILGDLKLGVYAYDSLVTRDDAGTLWLFYASGSPNEVLGVDIHVKARRMLDPLTLDPASSAQTILSPEGLRSENRNENFIQILEGPLLARLGDYWGLSYSCGDFAASNYKTTFAFSRSLIPPAGQHFEKVVVPDSNHLWKNDGLTTEVLYTLQSENESWPNYVGNSVQGPGHANLVEVQGKHYLIFHGRNPTRTGRTWDPRCLWRVPVRVNVAPNVPRDQWITPLL